jgi:hypothetical protein
MHILGSSKHVARTVAGLVALAVPLSFGVAPAANAAAPNIKIIQNSAESITPGMVACGNTTNTAENHYYRRFDLAGGHNAATGFKVSQVVFGVESATSTDNTIPGNVLVWAIDHADAFTVANLEPVATVPVNLDSVADGTLMTVPIPATVPANKDMVIEVEVDAATTGKKFFLGSNTGAQTAEAYLRAAACAINEPTTMTVVGFGTRHPVLYATGKAQDCITAEAAVDAATAAAAPLAAAKTKATQDVTTATAADTAAKSKVAKAKKSLKKAKKSGIASKIKKAKKKVKKAKAAAKAAAAALAAANTALSTATTALNAANAKVATATATANTECAQPALPAPGPAPRSDGAHNGVVHGLVTASS